MPCTSPKKWKNTKRKYWNISKKKAKKGVDASQPPCYSIYNKRRKAQTISTTQGPDIFLSQSQNVEGCLVENSSCVCSCIHTLQLCVINMSQVLHKYHCCRNVTLSFRLCIPLYTDSTYRRVVKYYSPQPKGECVCDCIHNLKASVYAVVYTTYGYMQKMECVSKMSHQTPSVEIMTPPVEIRY